MSNSEKVIQLLNEVSAKINEAFTPVEAKLDAYLIAQLESIGDQLDTLYHSNDPWDRHVLKLNELINKFNRLKEYGRKYTADLKEDD